MLGNKDIDVSLSLSQILGSIQYDVLVYYKFLQEPYSTIMSVSLQGFIYLQLSFPIAPG